MSKGVSKSILHRFKLHRRNSNREMRSSTQIEIPTLSSQVSLSYSTEGTISTASTSTTGSMRELIKSDNHKNHHKSSMSTGLTLLYLIKTNLGAGLFAIPAAFKDSGLIGGSIGIPIMAALSIHCMHMLVKCTEVMKERRGDPNMSMDYSEVMETACLTGPSFAAKYSKFSRRLIKVSLFMKEISFCAIFLLFAGYYLYQLMCFYFPEREWTIRLCTCILSLVALLMAFVRHHSYLHAMSYVASAIKAISLIVLFVYVFQDLPSVHERPAFVESSYLLLFYGTVIFAFEGVTQALPLHDNMRSTRNFRGWNGVLNTGMVIIACLYFALGFYGYLKYGDYTYPSITMNLPKDRIVCQIVKIGLIIALLINYGCQMHAAIEITEKTIEKKVSCPKKKLLLEVAMRAAILIATVIIALLTTNLDLFISLVGSLNCTLVCLVFPPVLDMITFWSKMGLLRLIKNILIIILALVAFATGTAACIIAFVEHYTTGQSSFHTSGE